MAPIAKRWRRQYEAEKLVQEAADAAEAALAEHRASRAAGAIQYGYLKDAVLAELDK
jgi:hypothetical protein